MALNGLNITSPTLTQKSRVPISFQPVWTGTILDGVIKRGQTQVGTWTTSTTALTTSYRSGDTLNQPIHQGGNPFTIATGSLSKTFTVTRKTYAGLAALKVNRILRTADELELAGTRAGLSVARQLRATLPVTEQPQRLSAGAGGHDLRVYLSPEVRKFEEDHHFVDTTADFNAQMAQVLPNGAKFYDIRTATPVTYQSNGAAWSVVSGAGQPVEFIGGPRIVHDQTTGKSFRLEVNPFNFITCISYPNTPPVWQTPAGEVARLVENDLLSLQLLADDQDGDILTFSVVSGSLPPGGLLSTSGLLTMPALIPNTTEENWLDIDPTTRVTSAPNGVKGQIATIETGQAVYRSNAGQTGPITKDKTFVPINGQTYTATYTVRKIASDNLGITGLLRPQFDTWNGNDPTASTTVAAGTISGEGYTPANTQPSNADVDGIDPRSWELNKWYTISVTWTASGGWQHARPRLRLNRNTTGSFTAGQQSNARFEVLTQNVIKGTSYDSYAFTAQVSDGINPGVTRNFTIAVASNNAAPVWQTTGNLGSYQIGQAVSVPLFALDPEGQNITYSVVDPLNLPPGITLQSSNSTLVGSTQSVSSNTSYNFTVRASDGVKISDLQCSLSVVINQAPVWQTPMNLGTFTIGQTVSTSVLATDPDGDPLTYGFVGGTLPLGLTFNSATRVISGTIQSNQPIGNVPFSIVVDDQHGHQVTRIFDIDVVPAPNQAPTWQTSNNLSTYYRNDTVNIPLQATDPDGDTLQYSFIGGVMPGGLTLASNGLLSGTISGTAAYQVYSFDVQVSDGQGHTTNRTFQMSVQAPPSNTDANGCLLTTQTIQVTGSTSGGSVWGDNSFGYTTDSDWNKAALHAGIVGLGQTATIHLNYAGYKSNFPGSSRNGVTSTPWSTGWCAVTLSL